jgi:hypothetical protein
MDSLLNEEFAFASPVGTFHQIDQEAIGSPEVVCVEKRSSKIERQLRNDAHLFLFSVMRFIVSHDPAWAARRTGEFVPVRTLKAHFQEIPTLFPYHFTTPNDLSF